MAKMNAIWILIFTYILSLNLIFDHKTMTMIELVWCILIWPQVHKYWTPRSTLTLNFTWVVFSKLQKIGILKSKMDNKYI